MADISSITLQNGSSYNVKDTDARLGKGLQEMTLAQYNNLTSEQKNDGSVRFITDNGGIIMKNNVPYGSGGGSSTDDGIIISNSQPTSSSNKIWIDTSSASGASYLVPTVAEMNAADALRAKVDEIGIVINGNTSTINISAGQYVNLRNSSISGKPDGIYIAAQAISANTTIDASYLTTISSGGLNNLYQRLYDFYQQLLSKIAFYSGTLSSANWSGDAAPYSYTLTVSGILATDNPIIDVVMSGTYSTDIARNEAWQHIYRAVTAANTITFYAEEKPNVDLPVQITSMR